MVCPPIRGRCCSRAPKLTRQDTWSTRFQDVDWGRSEMMPRLRAVPSPRTDPDTSALDRIAHGDLGGLGELFDRHARQLWLFARRAAPAEDAEEVVSAVFARLVRIAGSYDRSDPGARSWLLGVTARLIRERRRSSLLRGGARTLLRRAGSQQLDELAVRRLRQRTLATANATLTNAPSKSPLRWAPVILLVLLVVVGAFLLRRRLAHVGSLTTTSARESTEGLRVGTVAEGSSTTAIERQMWLGLDTSLLPMPHRGQHGTNAARVSTSRRSTRVVDDFGRDGMNAEDLAYLRIVILLKEERKAEAALAAHAYLAQFPSGFRRVEVRSIASA